MNDAAENSKIQLQSCVCVCVWTFASRAGSAVGEDKEKGEGVAQERRGYRESRDWQTRREKNLADVPGVGVKFWARAEDSLLLKEHLQGDDKAAGSQHL